MEKQGNQWVFKIWQALFWLSELAIPAGVFIAFAEDEEEFLLWVVGPVIVSMFYKCYLWMVGKEEVKLSMIPPGLKWSAIQSDKPPPATFFNAVKAGVFFLTALIMMIFAIAYMGGLIR